MNNKAITPLQKISGIIILLVFLVMFIFAFFAPKGLLPKVIEESSIFKTFIPEKEGLDKQDKFSIPVDLKKDFDFLCNSIKDYKDSENCIISYKTFSNLEDRFQILFKDAGESLLIQLVSSKGQILDFCKVEGLKPSVVAGKNNAAKNFYNNHLWYHLWKSPPKCSPNCKPEYTEAHQVALAWALTDYKERGILASLKDGLEIKSDMQDQQFIYKPDKEHIAFFPTYDGMTLNLLKIGCDADEVGLDNDCLKDIQSGNLIHYCS